MVFKEPILLLNSSDIFSFFAADELWMMDGRVIRQLRFLGLKKSGVFLWNLIGQNFCYSRTRSVEAFYKIIKIAYGQNLANLDGMQ